MGSDGATRCHQNQTIQATFCQDQPWGPRDMCLKWFRWSFPDLMLDLLSSLRFPNASSQTENEQCPSLPRMTASPPMPLQQRGAGRERLLSSPGPPLGAPQAQRWSSRSHAASAGATESSSSAGRLWRLDPLHTALAGKASSHLADCSHHCQACRPEEPFGKVNRKLGSQTKNPPNSQPRRPQPSCQRKRL